MSSVDTFDINLEHDIDEQYQYEPGEVLRGHIVLGLKGTIKVKAIQVQIKGEATVSWEEDDGKNTAFRADETYIDLTQNLLEDPDGESITLEEGNHRYPLECLLPNHLPSSFIGKFGSITYVVKATLKEDKRFGLSTMITSEPFLVLRKLDISEASSLQEQRVETVEKRIFGGCLFCISGKVIATFTINRIGHLPGEDIFMDAEISNSSPRVVKAVQASILMHSTFHARHKSRDNVQVVNKKRDDWEMSFGEGRRWKNVRLTIPPYIPESRLDGCDIIDISYEIVFKVECSGKHELSIKIPLTVGTSSGGESAAAERKPSAADLGQWQHGDNYIMVGSGDTAADLSKAEDVDLDMNDEDALRFRRPMDPGETRKNPLFFSESQQIDSRSSESPQIESYPEKVDSKPSDSPQIQSERL